MSKTDVDVTYGIGMTRYPRKPPYARARPKNEGVRAMNTDAPETLKPCTFCGGNAELQSTFNLDHEPTHCRHDQQQPGGNVPR